MIKRSLFNASIILFSSSLQAITVSVDNPIELKFEKVQTTSKGNRSREKKGLPIHPSSGVSWFSNDQCLVVANFYESLIEIFQFDEANKSFAKIQSVSELEDKSVVHPIDVAVSNDNKWMAVTNYGSKSGVCIYEIDQQTKMMNAIPAQAISVKNRTHGVEFSPDGLFLGYTTLGNDGIAYILQNKIQANQKNPNYVSMREFGGKGGKLLPKAMVFSPDNRFIIIAYSPSILDSSKRNKEVGCLDVYSIDPITKNISSEPIYSTGTISEIRGCEDITFCPDNSSLVVSLTPYDEIMIMEFDSLSGQIGQIRPFLNNPSAGLKEPHGFSFSSNGRYLAVTKNVENGVIMIYEVAE